MKRDRIRSWVVPAAVAAWLNLSPGSALAAEQAAATVAVAVPAPAAAVPTAAPVMAPPPPPPPGPPPTAAPMMAPPPPPPPGPVPVAAPTMVPAPPPPADVPPPPPPKPSGPTIGYTFGVRVGLRLQDYEKPKDMDEIHLDSFYDTTAEARFHGSVTDQFSWVVNFNASLAPSDGTLAGSGSVGVMDLIAQYKAAKEFNIWAGRLLVPSDRSNFSGPFFSLPWNYPGFYVAGAAPLGPKDGPTGRDQGAVMWGNALDDKLKYYGGAFGIDQHGAGTQPYLSGRVSYTLQGSEPGYFGSSTYYGAKDVATIGVGLQYQRLGAENVKSEMAAGCPGGPACKDNVTFMADALVEENVSGVGTFTFEGQFYKFTDGYVFSGTPGPVSVPIYAPDEGFYLLAAYLMPKPLSLQPLVRIQQTVDPGWTIFDAALAYVIKDYSARVVATYEHIDRGTSISAIAPNPVQNSLQLGIQLQSL